MASPRYIQDANQPEVTYHYGMTLYQISDDSEPNMSVEWVLLVILFSEGSERP